MKRCSYCAEEIQDEAIKCKHCGEMLKEEAKVEFRGIPREEAFKIWRANPNDKRTWGGIASAWKEANKDLPPKIGDEDKEESKNEESMGNAINVTVAGQRKKSPKPLEVIRAIFCLVIFCFAFKICIIILFIFFLCVYLLRLVSKADFNLIMAAAVIIISGIYYSIFFSPGNLNYTHLMYVDYPNPNQFGMILMHYFNSKTLPIFRIVIFILSILSGVGIVRLKSYSRKTALLYAAFLLFFSLLYIAVAFSTPAYWAQEFPRIMASGAEVPWAYLGPLVINFSAMFITSLSLIQFFSSHSIKLVFNKSSKKLENEVK